ncbi:MAG: cytochrome c [Vicinamibacterales bacterium]
MTRRLLFAVIASLGLGSLLTADAGRTAAAEAPTFAKDVAPILYAKCATCHRPGEVAPMSLLSYQEARPWAKAIKIKVASREMPPWGANPALSLPMRNDVSLTDAEIATLSAWADAGAPRGNDAEAPAPPAFTEGWTYGREPDAILEMPVEFEIPAEGELGVQTFYSKIPFTEDKFAEVLELRPGNRAVVHHSGVFVVDLPEGAQIVDGRLLNADGKPFIERTEAGLPRNDGGSLPGSSKLLSWVPGRGLDRHRPAVGKRIPAGKYLNWQIHYNPTGKPETDRTRLGIWFNRQPVTHELLIRQAGDPLATDARAQSLYRAEGREILYQADEGSTRRRSQTPNIPPYVENWSLIGITPVTEPITLYAMSPHMHLRGKSLRWVVVYPDGREQTILDVPKFDFNWQFNYELEEPLRIPAGSKIVGYGIYDNSVKNKWNPAPHLPVYWSEQSWDEMYQAFTEYTVDSQVLSGAKAAPSSPPRRR